MIERKRSDCPACFNTLVADFPLMQFACPYGHVFNGADLYQIDSIADILPPTRSGYFTLMSAASVFQLRGWERSKALERIFPIVSKYLWRSAVLVPDAAEGESCFR